MSTVAAMKWSLPLKGQTFSPISLPATISEPLPTLEPSAYPQMSIVDAKMLRTLDKHMLRPDRKRPAAALKRPRFARSPIGKVHTTRPWTQPHTWLLTVSYHFNIC